MLWKKVLRNLSRWTNSRRRWSRELEASSSKTTRSTEKSQRGRGLPRTCNDLRRFRPSLKLRVRMAFWRDLGRRTTRYWRQTVRSIWKNKTSRF